MQIHHLSLSAVGPFVGEHHIDFGELSASGLFLLEGPTGAGKSTIIDAIVYGLYGSVASKEASDDRIRSDHAADTQETYVDLIFETSHGIFRVLRQPARMRPKKRGEGLTRQNAQGLLSRLSVAELDQITQAYAQGAAPTQVAELEVGQVISTRFDEIGPEITGYIGLTKEQFSQTIVLPQGEFSKFLRSVPEDRRQLLQRVFGTEIYERAQDQLAALKRDAEKLIERQRVARNEAVRAFVQAVENPELNIEDLLAAEPDTLGVVLEQEIARLRERAEETSDNEWAAVEAERIAAETLQSAKDQVARFAQRERLRAELEQLMQRDAEITTAETRHALAVRASYVTPYVDAVDAAEEAQNVALNNFISAVEVAQDYAELGAMNGDISQGSRSSVEVFARSFSSNRVHLNEQRDAAQHAIGELSSLVSVEAELPRREASRERDRSRLEALKEEQRKVLERLRQRPAQRVELIERRDSLNSVVAHVPQGKAAVERAEDMLKTHTLKDTAAQRVAEATVQVSKQAEHVAAANQREYDLRTAWLGQLAATVAEQLQPGQPCAVCGSLEHPAPARVDPESATKQDVERAEHERRESEKLLASLHVKQAAAEERLNALIEQTGSSTREDVQRELVAAQEALTRMQAAEQDLKATVRALADHETETKRLEESEKSSAVELSALSARITEQTVALETDRARVAEAVAQYAAEVTAFHKASNPGSAGQGAISLAQVIAFLKGKVEAISSVLAALEELHSAQGALSERTVELNRALAEHAFDSVQEVRAGTLSTAERGQLSEQVRRYRERVAVVSAQLESAELCELPETLSMDVDALNKAHTDAQVKARQAGHLAKAASKTLKDGEYRSTEVKRAMERLHEVDSEARPTIRMAEIAAGTSSDNISRTTLATYVLKRRFEDVVEAANTRLRQLSEGRYELARSDEREDVASRRTGLALRVIDHETEKERDPRTLSGGETFNASLSLALGLADVVTGEAGGVELGTLFIDEGFGTLDPEALDRVVAVLGNLRDGGRTVGVVSHVETLKQAISDGITVTRLLSGASTLTVRA